MTDQPIPEEAVEAASRAHTRALCDPRTGFRDCVAAGLAAAYPHLRQQWLREAESRLAEFKAVMLFAPPFGNDYPVDAVPWTNVRVALDDNAWRINEAARGAAQPGGTE